MHTKHYKKYLYIQNYTNENLHANYYESKCSVAYTKVKLKIISKKFMLIVNDS